MSTREELEKAVVDAEAAWDAAAKAAAITAYIATDDIYAAWAARRKASVALRDYDAP